MIEIREKLVNASTGDVRPGNLLPVKLGDDIEQITVDGDTLEVKYYYVQTPDTQWRKTEYYEEVSALFSIVYLVNNNEYHREQLRAGDAVTPYDFDNSDEGYEWSGWIEAIPEVMPSEDVIIHGTATPKQFTLFYVIDGLLVQYFGVTYNSANYVSYNPPSKDGYSFSGWSSHPDRMPAHDVTLTGSYIRNTQYTLTYMIDNSVYATESHSDGEVLTALEEPEIETGYTWTGWIDFPYYMPSENWTVNSSLIPNQYALDYYVDSSLWKSINYDYKASIVSETYTPPTGKVFSGWQNEPETMPAIDHYIVSGRTATNFYDITFMSDSSTVYASYKLTHGDQIPELEIQKEGYVFLGWNPEVPQYVTDSSITTYAQFASVECSVNWYMIDNNDTTTAQLLTTQSYVYGDDLIVPEVPSRIGWKSSVLETQTKVFSDMDCYINYDRLTYQIYYYVDESLLKTASYAYDASVDTTETAEKYGYTFVTWNPSVPSTMPANDIYTFAQFDINSHKIYYYVDSSCIRTETYNYNEAISPAESVTKEGYTFTGWYPAIPNRMPNSDFITFGQFDINSYKIYYYVDSSCIRTETYNYNEAISPAESPSKEGYNFTGWNPSVPSTMPTYDISTSAQFDINSYKIYYYVDSSCIRTETYNYNEAISPVESPSKEGYTFVAWDPEVPSRMPAYDISTSAQFIKVPVLSGTVTWYLDNEYYYSSMYEYGSTVTSPISSEADYDYNWEYDTFVMPTYDTSVHGERVAKTTPVPTTYTVYWYIDSSLIQTGEYESGNTVTSPLCQEPDYIYKWYGYDTFRMPAADTSIYGTKQSTLITIDTSLFGISLEQYGTSVEHPVVDFGYIYDEGASYIHRGSTFISAESRGSRGIRGYIYIQKPNTSSDGWVMEYIDSSIPATFKYQISTDGANWTDAVNVEFDTDVENKTTVNNIVYLPELSSQVYVRLALNSINISTLTLNQITNGIYYSILFGSIPIGSPDGMSVFALDNKQTGSKYLVFGDYEWFYSYVTLLLNTIFNVQFKMHGLLLSISNKICNAHNAYEHTAHNFITSGYRKYGLPNGYYGSFVNNYPETCTIETAPVNLATDVYNYCYLSRWSDCTSLVTAPQLPATSLAYCCYKYMFKGCTSLVTAPELPATSLEPGCYMYMFSVCTSLVTAPQLPATSLADSCYAFMFSTCRSLVNPPQLPATSLARSCYASMFNICTSLVTAPELPATSLARSCYFGMFTLCSSLVNPPNLPATTVDDNAYQWMFGGCTSLVNPPVISGNVFGEYACQIMFRDCYSLTSRAVLDIVDASTNAFDQMYYGTSLSEE